MHRPMLSMVQSRARRASLAAWVLAVLAFTLPGCGRFKMGSYSAVEGSGVSKTESRSVGSFSEVEIGNAMKLQVQLGEKTAVEVTGDDNLVPLVQTLVTGDRLTVSFDGSYSTKIGISVKVTTPKLTALSGSGASALTATDFWGNPLKLQLSGASSASVSGKVETLDVECTGASRVLAKDLAAKAVKVDASGVSHVEVNASDQLDAKASGASSIDYVGKPKMVWPQASGASRVTELAR